MPIQVSVLQRALTLIRNTSASMRPEVHAQRQEAETSRRDGEGSHRKARSGNTRKNRDRLREAIYQLLEMTMQAFAQIADRVFNAQLIAHTAGRRFALESEQFTKRDQWALDRTAEIMVDSDYTPDLFAYLIAGDSRDINALERVKNATSADWIGALACLHEQLTKKARAIAESEAKVRWGF